MNFDSRSIFLQTSLLLSVMYVGSAFRFDILPSKPCPFPKRIPLNSCYSERLERFIISSRLKRVYARGVSDMQSRLPHLYFLLARRGARSPNLQVVINNASHVCSQLSFGLPLRMTGMHKTQFDHARFDLLPLVIWSCVACFDHLARETFAKHGLSTV